MSGASSTIIASFGWRAIPRAPIQPGASHCLQSLYKLRIKNGPMTLDSNCWQNCQTRTYHASSSLMRLKNRHAGDLSHLSRSRLDINRGAWLSGSQSSLCNSVRKMSSGRDQGTDSTIQSKVHPHANNHEDRNSQASSSIAGSKWDFPTSIPEKRGQETKSTETWNSMKDQIAQLGTEKINNANIQNNLKKLEVISRVSRRKQVYSPYLLISQLPAFVMPDDIQRMALTEDSIVDIIYHRNQFLEFQNRITVVFRSATDAVDFITQKYGKFLSGHRLIMSMLDPFSARDKLMIPPHLAPEPLSGQLVLVSGLPASARPDHLRTEFRRFQLMDTTEAAIIPIPSRRMATTCKYLIRLSSRSEAFRFVRTYHNTFFQYKEFRKRCPIRTTIIY
ncbi:hypothetical protein BGW38_004411 [Lunasporangiospora selenospora]|uniref:RRM domain-containing protein n=1 Tax=Lunasporangiospora selenospora TaxID=979761 RepID=A0A9P6KHD6_9FUNG|nr:hypothetical protein BGW38_004411 [Lunasporangiospora selenospora]